MKHRTREAPKKLEIDPDFEREGLGSARNELIILNTINELIDYIEYIRDLLEPKEEIVEGCGCYVKGKVFIFCENHKTSPFNLEELMEVIRKLQSIADRHTK